MWLKGLGTVLVEMEHVEILPEADTLVLVEVEGCEYCDLPTTGTK